MYIDESHPENRFKSRISNRAGSNCPKYPWLRRSPGVTALLIFSYFVNERIHGNHDILLRKRSFKKYGITGERLYGILEDYMPWFMAEYLIQRGVELTPSICFMRVQNWYTIHRGKPGSGQSAISSEHPMNSALLTIPEYRIFVSDHWTHHRPITLADILRVFGSLDINKTKLLKNGVKL